MQASAFCVVGLQQQRSRQRDSQGSVIVHWGIARSIVPLALTSLPRSPLQEYSLIRLTRTHTKGLKTGGLIYVEGVLPVLALYFAERKEVGPWRHSYVCTLYLCFKKYAPRAKSCSVVEGIRADTAAVSPGSSLRRCHVASSSLSLNSE